MDLSLYRYKLPESLIAKTPATPRDSARLFVYDTATDKITFDVFKNIGMHLPKKSLLVFNDTKVVPARITLKKDTGGKVELLFLINEYQEGTNTIRALSDRKLEVGRSVSFEDGESCLVVNQEENIFTLKFTFSFQALLSLLIKYGKTPIPKYIKGESLSEDVLRERYQTIFAKDPASVAAPTASLHFTDIVREDLRGRGMGEAYATLRVGLGTFAPVTENNLSSNTLHTEFYDVSQENFELIVEAKKEGRSVVAVGTTVVRALESKFRDGFIDEKLYKFLNKNNLQNFQSTNMFIRPPYNFKIVDTLITNFHVPESSLMMLVEAFLKYKKSPKHLIDLYNIAIGEGFRFYSFGDAMLII